MLCINKQKTTLRGSRADGAAYASPVEYWVPFTLDGCGFHDADWRKNWSNTAYLKEGSFRVCQYETK